MRGWLVTSKLIIQPASDRGSKAGSLVRSLGEAFLLCCFLPHLSTRHLIFLSHVSHKRLESGHQNSGLSVDATITCVFPSSFRDIGGVGSCESGRWKRYGIRFSPSVDHIWLHFRIRRGFIDIVVS